MNDITNANMTVIKFVSDNDVGQLTVLWIFSFVVLFLVAFKLFLFLLDKNVLKNS